MLAFLAALIPGGLPSLATLRLVAIGTAFLAWSALAGYIGYSIGILPYEKLKAHDAAAQAKAEAHELDLQKLYDAIGAKDERDYLTRQAAIQAETERQLQEIPNVQMRSARKSASARGKHDRSAGGSDSDVDRAVRVLQSIAKPN